MNNYIPDAWVILEMTSKEYGTIKKILAGWYGGYGGSDMWKLSSGNLQEYMEDGFIVFPQDSGSVYRCHPSNQKLSGYTAQILDNIKSKCAGVASIEIVKYTLDPSA